MEERKVTVKIKNIQSSPQKLRLVANLVRGKDALLALDELKYLNKKGSLDVEKALKSSIANAADRFSWGPEKLYISKISVDEAPTYKRFRIASRGRISRIFKRRSHLNLEIKQRA
jgi:large subunit ribosomal protein L22